MLIVVMFFGGKGQSVQRFVSRNVQRDAAFIAYTRRYLRQLGLLRGCADAAVERTILCIRSALRLYSATNAQNATVYRDQVQPGHIALMVEWKAKFLEDEARRTASS
jgi:hypothetical protein